MPPKRKRLTTEESLKTIKEEPSASTVEPSSSTVVMSGGRSYAGTATTVSSKPPDRIRNASITINNWEDEDLTRLNALTFRYMIIGKEGKKKTPHLQVYVEFANAISFNSLVKQLPNAHIEYVRSSTKCIEYCKKEGDYKEYGIPKTQGTRTDLDEMRQLALTGGMRAVTRVATQGQIQTVQSFLSFNEPVRDWEPNVIWIYGPTKANKSRLARKILNSITPMSDPSYHDDTFTVNPITLDDIADPYTKNDKSKWWTGYDGHPNVIFDDFRDSWWSMTEMLALLDRYEYRVELKGLVRQFRARNIIITSIRSPYECYSKMRSTEPHVQLIRRLSEIINVEYYYSTEGKYDQERSYFKSYTRLQDSLPTDPHLVRRGIVYFEQTYPECLEFLPIESSRIRRNEEESVKRKIKATLTDIVESMEETPRDMEKLKLEIESKVRESVKKDSHFETLGGRERSKLVQTFQR